MLNQYGPPALRTASEAVDMICANALSDAKFASLLVDEIGQIAPGSRSVRMVAAQEKLSLG